MNCKIYINGKETGLDKIENWERKRLRAVAKKLKCNAKTTTELADFKQKLGRTEITKDLQFEIKLSSLTSKILSAISSGKRKISAIEMLVEEDITAKKISEEIDRLMLVNSRENEFVNLSANPDHYVLHAENNTLQVIETTGGSPLPVEMFITFGEEKGLTIPRDNSFPFQSVGIARLKDGTVIGGVRHQFKDEGEGFRAKLAVEFPLFTPDYFIEQHKIHLACEWKNWFRWIIAKNSEAEKF